MQTGAINISEEASLQTCIQFLKTIGIDIFFKNAYQEGFLPGLIIENGSIIIDKNNLKYPGDILHEAGHIAVTPAANRKTLNTNAIINSTTREAEEMMAIAWSYAACVYLQINTAFVFHDNGYKGGGNNIAENFKNKRYIGVSMLQWIGLTVDEKTATALNINPYPAMIKWLRD